MDIFPFVGGLTSIILSSFLLSLSSFHEPLMLSITLSHTMSLVYIRVARMFAVSLLVLGFADVLAGLAGASELGMGLSLGIMVEALTAYFILRYLRTHVDREDDRLLEEFTRGFARDYP